jgi:DNA mismatch repair protein MutL
MGMGAGISAGADLVSEPAPFFKTPSPVRAHTQGDLGIALRPAEALSAGKNSPRWFTPPFRYIGQIESSYLVFEAKGGLFLMDQHAAAERILFEKLTSQIEEGTLKSQRLAVPFIVELPASKISEVLEREDRLKRLGFELSAFGKNKLRFSSVPALLAEEADLKETLYRLIDSVFEATGASDALKESQREALATVACKASVKAHDRLSAEEALRLLEDLKNCRDGSSCPHGRRAILAMDREELARRFQRPGAPPL